MKHNEPKPLSEYETKQKLLFMASQLGCHMELIQIYDKYEKLLRFAKTDLEKRQISILGNVEIHKLFDFRNALVVNGEEILPISE